MPSNGVLHRLLAMVFLALACLTAPATGEDSEATEAEARALIETVSREWRENRERVEQPRELAEYRRALAELKKIAPDHVPLIFEAWSQGGDYPLSEILRWYPDEVVPLLIPLLETEDDELRSLVFYKLSSCGERAGPAIPKLTELARSDDDEVSAAALGALCNLKKAAPVLADLLDEVDAESRWRILSALQHMQEAAVPAVPQLIEALDSEDRREVETAAKALEWIGPDASDAIDRLFEMALNADWTRKRYAFEALGGIGDRALVPYAGICLGGDFKQRQLAVEGLKSLGDRAAPLLTLLLNDPSEDIRRSACFALGEASRLALPELLDLTGDMDGEVRQAAAHAIGRSGDGDASAQEALARLLDDRDAQVRLAALRALGSVGIPASAEPAVCEFAKNGLPPERFAAARTLRQRGIQSELVLDTLCDLFREVQHPSEPVVLPRYHTPSLTNLLDELGSIGADASAATPLVLDALERDVHYRVMRECAATLEKIGAGDPRVGPVIVKLLKSGNAAYHFEVISLLSLSDGGEETGRLLEEFVNSGNESYGDKALVTLASYAEHAEFALPRLWARFDAPPGCVPYDPGEPFVRLGEAARPFLEQKLQAEPAKRVRTLSLLLRIDPGDEDTRAALRDELAADPYLNPRGLPLFEYRQPPLAEDVLLLAPRLRHEDEWVRLSAVDAYSSTEADLTPIADEFLQAYLHAEGWEETDIARQLHRLGPRAAPVSGKLLASLDAVAYGHQNACAQALGAIGDDSPEVIEALTSRLDTDDLSFRGTLIDALFKLDHAEEVSAADLAPLIKRHGSKEQALEWAMQVGAWDDGVIPLLREALDDRNADVRAAAREALLTLRPGASLKSPGRVRVQCVKHMFALRRTVAVLKQAAPLRWLLSSNALDRYCLKRIEQQKLQDRYRAIRDRKRAPAR